MNINVRNILLIVIALIVAGVTAMMARSWLASAPASRQEAGTAVSTNRIEVAVAKQNMPAGYKLQASDLRWQAWPVEKIPDQYVTRGKNGDKNGAKVSLASFQGAIVRTGLAAGEPVTWGQLVKQGDRGFLAAILTPGMRAVSIKVNAISGISGLVFPGDRVDLILSHSISQKGADGQKNTRQVSETILTGIRILAIDQNTQDQENKATIAKTITLEASPKQAEEIALASNLGELSLSLRSMAKTGQELARIAKNGPQNPDVGTPPQGGGTYTWDNEVSHVIAKSATTGVGNSVKVSRGDKTETVEFR